MTAFRTLDDAGSLQGKRVLLRVDLNVPMEGERVTDATRIERIVPTIREIADGGGRVVLLAHFGRPKGKPVVADSLKQVVSALSQHLGRPVAFAEDCIGETASSAVSALKDGDVLLLENTRFHTGEEKNEAGFVAALAANGDVFVNEAFSAAHRAHASTEGLAHVLPAYAGRLMQAELDALTKGLESPTRPVIALVGGAKVSSKIDLLQNLVAKVDMLVIGGGMANTFLHAQGKAVGKSLCEKDLAETALRILDAAAAAKCRIILPVDAVVATEFKANAAHETVGVDAVSETGMILDAGPASVAEIDAAIDEGCDPGLERPSRRLRTDALRRRDGGGGAPRGRAYQGRQARLSGGRRRHGGRPQPCRRRRRFLLRIHRRWCVPRMAGRQGPARRRGPARQGVTGSIPGLITSR